MPIKKQWEIDLEDSQREIERLLRLCEDARREIYRLMGYPLGFHPEMGTVEDSKLLRRLENL